MNDMAMTHTNFQVIISNIQTICNLQRLPTGPIHSNFAGIMMYSGHHSRDANEWIDPHTVPVLDIGRGTRSTT